ncbi:hypothetical protein FQN60_015973 [Etheostoma spectabile]|uniref:Uncharacterized protein n=1 Tax=Etheostoma spectabile TaxID=54343 RepID=A0A5J5CNX5_9PERO|nr:hypothetical protein FQN60_015973 [Etheostoma spectabile]
MESILHSHFLIHCGFLHTGVGTLRTKRCGPRTNNEVTKFQTGTGSTSAGIPSRFDIFRNWRKPRDGYNMSSSAPVDPLPPTADDLCRQNDKPTKQLFPVFFFFYLIAAELEFKRRIKY